MSTHTETTETTPEEVLREFYRVEINANGSATVYFWETVHGEELLRTVTYYGWEDLSEEIALDFGHVLTEDEITYPAY